MKSSIRIGLSFGLTSGIITTLGLMVGLAAGTSSKIVVIGGIITIAVADALSDALGIHLSQESETLKTHKQVWESTFATFVSKFVFALTFLIPVIFLDLFFAIIVSIIWGFFLLGLLSHIIARRELKLPGKVVFEHWTIAIIVILATFFVGRLISGLIA